MPGTRSRASAVTQIHDDADEQQEASTGLAFNQPLTWRAGKPIPVAELLRRLQALSQELRGLDQEEADRGALMPVAKELASQNLLSHKDRGVRAWTGCCIVDMFRLCAPDAPYTASQLKDIFMLFINTIFRALSDPSDPYNSQHFTLMTALFTICFDVLSATLVEESQGLPPEVVDVILAQFLRADPRQSTLLLKEAPPAYNMAKNICNACADKMARLISQYFSSVIVDATTAAVGPLHKSGKHRGRTESSIGDEPDDDRPRHVTEEDLQESRKAHRLLRELWRSAPMVLQDIMLQLEAELAGPPPPPSRNDKSPVIRSAWVTSIAAIKTVERVRDRKPAVRTEATNLLGKVWGVAAGDVNVLIDHVLFEQLLPLGYPALKNKSHSDKLRVERILILIRDLVQRSKVVLFAKQGNQVMLAKYMEALLKKCEDYNGGVMEKGEKETKLHLGKLIDYHAKTLPESSRASEDLWKFAKMHDRRAYQLIRFCIAPDSDYRKVYKAIKEFTKRMDDATASVLLYNKSHVPAIIEFSRTDEKGLGSTAHEVLKEISSRNPDVFRGYVQEMCKALENEAPTAKKPNGPGAVDDLKACAGFAKRFPKDVPTERKFIQSMINFAEYGTPPKAAKYGVQIILTSTDKKEMHARDLLRKSTKGFEYGKGNYLARLAAMSQLMLLGGKTIEDEIDPVIDICINQVLLTNPAPVDPADNPPWKDEPSEDCTAKMWALKVLVNRLRGLAGNESIKETSTPVFQLLRTLVTNDGELSKKVESPAAQKTRLRLLAAQLLLKLCHERRFDVLLSGQAFNELAVVAQDPNPNVREGFVKKLMKYLGQDKLPRRFYAPVFLLAFEPEPRLKDGATTWIKARQSAFSKTKDPVFENSFARFLSLLAHHPDYSAEPDNLRDFVQYVMFFLKTVANADNISLIYHVAQRVKSVEDAIEPAKSENLYVLSDLAQGVIQRFQTLHGWSIQAFSKKARMPADVFANLPGHEVAQEIADKQYVPEELVDELDDLVKASMRTKKRKTDSSGDAAREKKRARASLASTRGLPVRKAPKLGKTKKAKKARKGEDVPASERRRSGRVVGDRSYAELSSDDEENADEDEVSDEEEGSEGEGDEDVEMVDQPSEGEEEVADEEAEDEDDEGQNGATGDQEEEEDEEEVEEEQPPPKATPRRARGASRKSAAAETPKGGGGGSAVKSAKGKDKEKGKKSKKADEVVATTPRASRRGGKAAADDKPNGEATPAKGDSAEGGRRSTRRSGRS
ncbi:Sister chromatid cohesion and DNA repair protein [Lasiodiplodia theobromae]|uniref:Sister chromatid cohesion and DNA repair protein n=1 Tax=Lasiodiplodia theobromae TaxID=45133 RepID=UPI0015C305E6|nr:Sister chromatid cohesion and DNA repair protein [Lasiodiplodia theobromae]KAF4538763.1 Sister chromatid cohesion and DNA repair protein [Lasiodiplodia theobromae]